MLFASVCGSVIGAAHAGWRGLAGSSVNDSAEGILEATLAAIYKHFRDIDQSNRARAAPEIIAWLGPCIGPSAFEVGTEVKAAFESGQADAGRYFVAGSSGKYWADLAGLARSRLTALGVSQIYGNDSSLPWCTASNASRFFSHRRDARVDVNDQVDGVGRATTGRMAASIWLA